MITLFFIFYVFFFFFFFYNQNCKLIGLQVYGYKPPDYHILDRTYKLFAYKVSAYEITSLQDYKHATNRI
jgi:hypothetical protein